MEHTWSKNHPQYCTACDSWLPKSNVCLGEPRRTQIVPPKSEDPDGEARAQTRYERHLGW